MTTIHFFFEEFHGIGIDQKFSPWLQHALGNGRHQYDIWLGHKFWDHTVWHTRPHTHTDSKNEWQKVDKTFLQSSCQEKVADVSTVCGCECWEWCSSTRRAQRAGAAPTKWYSLWNSMLSSSIIFMQLLTARFRQRLPFKEAGVFYISRRGISQRHWECTLIWDTVPGLLACKAVFGGRKKRPWTSSRKLLRVV